MEHTTRPIVLMRPFKQLDSFSGVKIRIRFRIWVHQCMTGECTAYYLVVVVGVTGAITKPKSRFFGQEFDSNLLRNIDLQFVYLGCVLSSLEVARVLYKMVFACLRHNWETEPAKKQFKIKNKNVPILDSYQRGKDFGEEYWSKWIWRDYSSTRQSYRSHRIC